MKFTFLLFLITNAIVLSTVDVAQADEGDLTAARVYHSYQGDMDLNKLGAMVSENFLKYSVASENVTVLIESVRWPFNPFDYSGYLLFGNFATYVVRLTINGKHQASCNFSIKLMSQYGIFHDCSSRTAVVDPPGAYRLKDFMSNLKNLPEQLPVYK